MSDLAVIEAILRNRYRYFAEVRDGVDLGAKLRAMLGASFVFLALYGAVIGSQHSVLQALSSAVKLPALFLVTLLVCLPTLHFFNVLYGAGLSIRQNFALILTAVTVTSVLLLSFAPVVMFFLITTAHYQFFKLLNVAVFAVCGLIGLGFLSQGVTMIATTDREGARARSRLVRFWALLYAFVGSQLAWTLRPFFGAPGLAFEPFRDLGGNFYANVLASLGEVLGFFTVHPGG
jgi:hypothetical protein